MSAPLGLSALQVRAGHPDFLDLPWDRRLAEWRGVCPRLVDVPRGLSRHEVVFAQYGRALYAVKELPPELGEREYDALRWLEDRDMPAVTPAGHACVRTPDGVASVLITRFLDNSLPYRTLFQNPGLERYRARLLDSIAGLLVRLHLAGFHWGDFSLSNTLFLRDAGELQAYLVDAETSEMHEQLSDGQRNLDLEILEMNVAGELEDLSMIVELPPSLDVFETGALIRQRYDQLWAEITREEVLAPGEHWRIHERIKALNALGFSVGEIDLVATEDGSKLRMRTIVTDRDYHRHTLHGMTGIIAEERQAAVMVNDIRELRATMVHDRNVSVPLSVAAHQWRTDRYDPTVARLASLIGAQGEAPELFCQVLENKWYLSEKAGEDVGLEAASDDFIRRFAEGATG